MFDKNKKKGQRPKRDTAKVSSEMKKMKEKAAKALIKIAKKGHKNDLESTGSSWSYQPVIPNNKKTDRK